MANTRLEIGTDENVAVFNDIPIDITLQISDISDPTNRKGSKSKTINIPGTPEVNALFENIFLANTALQTYDPNLKEDAVYYADELPQIKGYVQMLGITVNETTGEVIYQLSLIGELITLFTDIQGLYLTDIDLTNYWNGTGFQDFTHTLNYTPIVNSWGVNLNLVLGQYVYPLIDFGVNNSNFNFVQPEHLRACIYARVYMYGIFYNAGYTWTSTFLDSILFKRLIIPPTSVPTISQTVINNNKFLAVTDGTQTIATTFAGSGYPTLGTSTTAYTDIAFQTETYDTGGVFATPTWTCATTNKYNITVNIGVSFVFKKNGVPYSGSLVTGVTGNLTIELGTGANGIAQVPIDGSTDFTSVQYFNIPLVNYNVWGTATSKVRFRWENTVISTAEAGSGADTWTVEATIVSGSNFSVQFYNGGVYEGATVNPNTLIPENVLQVDFVKSIFRMFNLYAVVDKTNKNNLIIEPRNTFYGQTAIDWTEKHDANSLTEVVPLGDINYKRYKFRYKQDQDFLNKVYYNDYLEPYGSETREVDNDFVKGESVTDVIFSPTPYTYPPNLPSMVIPAIYNKENNIVSPAKSNIRILYWAGTLTLPSSQWSFKYNGGSSLTTFTTFPAAGHTNNPYAPTIDLSWDEPYEVYYNYPNQQWTNNNLFNAYHLNQYQESTDKDSRIVTTNFWLTSLDISEWDFRSPVFWKDAYYLVQSIDYNPLINAPSKVRMLKLTHYDEFVPVTEYKDDNDTGGYSFSQLVFGDNITKGENNTNIGLNSMIMGGGGNFIDKNSESVSLINCNNVTVAGVTNFTGIGLSNLTIDSTYDNTTEIAGFSGGGSGSGEIIDLGNRADLGQFNIGDRI
jgi:hypothetical protein